MDIKSKFEKFSIALVELFDRVIPYDNNDKIYKNDVDNLYPNRMENLERNSKTATSCSNKLGQYIFGKGFENPNFQVKTSSGKTIDLNECLQLVTNSIKTHKGAFIHLNYDIDNEVNYFDVLKYKNCRIYKEDHFGFKGNIIYKDWAKNTSIFDIKKNNDVQWFYPYNKNTINDQRKKDATSKKTEDLIRNYRGQVLFLSLEENQIYPYAWLNGQSVYDANSEFQLALYRNNSIRKGFQDKTMFILNGLDPETKREFDKNCQNWLGAEESGSLFTFGLSEYIENPEKIIVPIQLKSSYDSKKFETDEVAFEDSIAKCYLDIPKVLINPNSGGIFGASGETMKEAQKLYSRGCDFIRIKIEKTFMDIFEIENLRIIPLIEEEVAEDKDNAELIRLNAQSELKGSVGGVTALMELVKAVNLNEIPVSNAIEIVKEIYGISEELASKMLIKEIANDNL